MKPHQIENWALSIIERIEKGQPIEDSMVELKADWIEPVNAARRLAGHANAARGNKILWLIGIDENKGVTGINYQDFAQWFKQTTSFFSEMFPRADSYNIPISGKTVAAVLFETDRAPFVVKNPLYGKQGSGSIEREVPWREGTSIRSATRSDLIKILSPLQMLPNFEVLNGSIKVTKSTTNENISYYWRLALSLYVDFISETNLVIPFHRCKAEMQFIDSGQRVDFKEVRLNPPRKFRISSGDREVVTSSLTIDSTREEIILSGPGSVALDAECVNQENPEFCEKMAEVSIYLQAVGAERDMFIRAELVKTDPKISKIFSVEWMTPEGNS